MLYLVNSTFSLPLPQCSRLISTSPYSRILTHIDVDHCIDQSEYTQCCLSELVIPKSNFSTSYSYVAYSSTLYHTQRYYTYSICYTILNLLHDTRSATHTRRYYTMLNLLHDTQPATRYSICYTYSNYYTMLNLLHDTQPATRYSTC